MLRDTLNQYESAKQRAEERKNKKNQSTVNFSVVLDSNDLEDDLMNDMAQQVAQFSDTSSLTSENLDDLIIE